MGSATAVCKFTWMFSMIAPQTFF